MCNRVANESTPYSYINGLIAVHTRRINRHKSRAPAIIPFVYTPGGFPITKTANRARVTDTRTKRATEAGDIPLAKPANICRRIAATALNQLNSQRVENRCPGFRLGSRGVIVAFTFRLNSHDNYESVCVQSARCKSECFNLSTRCIG